MPASRLSDGQRAEMVEQFRQGVATVELANAYGCSPNTVSRLVKAGMDEAEYELLKRQRQRRAGAADGVAAGPGSALDLPSAAEPMAPETTAPVITAPDITAPDITASEATASEATAAETSEEEPTAAEPEAKEPAPAIDPSLAGDPLERLPRQPEQPEQPALPGLLDGHPPSRSEGPLHRQQLPQSEQPPTPMPSQLPRPAAEEEPRSPREAEPASPLALDHSQEAEPGVLAIEDADDFGEEDDDLGDDDQEFSEESLALEGVFVPVPLLQIGIEANPVAARAWSAASLPSSAYMLVEKNVELQPQVLRELPELGYLPEDEQERQALVLYVNPRQAKRQCGRNQRVIPIPDTQVFELTASKLVAQGITRVVVEGSLFALPGC